MVQDDGGAAKKITGDEQLSEMVGLDIGCGTNRVSREGYKILRFDIRPEVKPNVVGNAIQLPFADNSLDLVMSSHVLEHFPRGLWKQVLAEWIRVLKCGGELWLNLPNIMWAAERMAIDHVIDENVMNVLYGAQENPFDYHYHGMTPELVKLEFDRHGLELIHFNKQSYNMFLGARRN